METEKIICKMCGKMKVITDFLFNTNYKRGYAPYCKECRQKYNKEKYKKRFQCPEKREIHRQISHNWYMKNREKIKARRQAKMTEEQKRKHAINMRNKYRIDNAYREQCLKNSKEQREKKRKTSPENIKNEFGIAIEKYGTFNLKLCTLCYKFYPANTKYFLIQRGKGFFDVCKKCTNKRVKFKIWKAENFA